MGLASASIGWEERRDNMKDVCSACHEETWIENFYIQYDGLRQSVERDKFAKPGLALYKAAKPLLQAGQVRQQAGLHLVRVVAS